MINIMLQQNTLQINVAQLLKSPLGTTRNYAVEEEVDVAGGSRPIRGEVTLTRSDRSILVRGILYLDVDLNCGRCLREFSSPLTIDIEEEYFPTINIYTGNDLPAPEDRESFMIDERNVLDLLEAVRQYASLAVPIKPLCRPDCAGLCPACGHNLNEGSCICPPESADPRWDKLRQAFSAANKTPVNERKGMK